MSSANPYIDEEAEVSSDDENFQVSEDEASEDEEEEAKRLNKEMIADDEEVEAELKRARTDRRRHAQSTEELVDDDYLLLEDHHGVRFNRKRKPSQGDTTGYGKKKRLQRRLESEDEEADQTQPRSKQTDQYEVDDYGLSDDGQEQEKEDWLEDDIAPRRNQSNRRAVSLFGDAGDIFGDMTDFLAQSQMVDELIDDLGVARRDSQVEPSLAARHMVTPADEVIQTTDQPERLQARIVNRVFPDEDPKEFLFQEAEWIHQTRYSSFPPDTTVPAIMAVLEMIRSHNLDVPYIQTYQKDYYSPLHPEDIWIIDQCDERWDHIVAKRINVARQLEKHIPDDSELMSKITCALDDDEIEDIRNFAISRHSSLSVKKVLRRHNAPEMTGDSLMESLAHTLFLEPRQVGQNFRARFVQFPPSDPELSPESFAEGLVSDKYTTPQEVLAAARLQCALSVANDPFVRSAIRERFMEIAVICTSPTEKGRQVIDWAHEYYEVRHLVNKPLRLFLSESSAQFALLTRAETEGFIISSIYIPESDNVSNPLVLEFQELFQSLGTSLVCQQWNEQRRLIFLEIVNRFLFKSMNVCARRKLVLAAHEAILDRATKRLRDILCLAPQPRDKLVCACSVGDRSDPTYAVIIDRQGLIVDHISLPYMKLYVRKSNTKNVHDLKCKKGHDARRFRSFVERYSPSFIAISADSLDSREFFSEVRLALQNRTGDIPVEFVDPFSARIAMNSRRMSEELSEHPSLLRHAVALARYVQDPLTEVCSSAVDPTDLASMPLDPLQNCLPQAMFLRGLHRVLTEFVNHVGVDINLAVSNTHLQGPLSFVSGLGPRKSKAIIDFLKRNGAVSSRDQLSKILGECVYRNCIGFLKVIAPPFSQMSISPLDETRIHPEHYLLSDRVVLNALDLENSQGDLEAPRFSLILQLRSPAKRYKLDELDFQAYAESMESEGEGKFFQTLQMIKSELKFPFADILRHPFEPESPESLFRLLSGEQPDVTLFRGQIIDVVVTGVTRAGILARLDSGVAAFIPSSAYPETFADRQGDQDLDKIVSEAFKPGSTLRTRLVSIDYERFRVELTASERDLRDNESWETPFRSDPYNQTIEEAKAESDNLSLKNVKAKPVRKFIPRNIDHPLFANVDRESAENMLKEAPVGDVVIRPSRLGTHQLTITWKFAEDIFVHIAVVEKDKPHDVAKALGRRLTVENEQFEDLDEILARYIRPLTKLAESVVQEKCFRYGSEEEIDTLLKDEKEDEPKRIPYFFGFSSQHPGLFVFSFLPSKRVIHELIKLTPKGYRFQKRYFTKPSQVVAYVKAEFVKQVKASSRKAASVAAQQPAGSPPKSSSRWGEPITQSYGRPHIHPDRLAAASVAAQQPTGSPPQSGSRWGEPITQSYDRPHTHPDRMASASVDAQQPAESPPKSNSRWGEPITQSYGRPHINPDRMANMRYE